MILCTHCDVKVASTSIYASFQKISRSKNFGSSKNKGGKLEGGEVDSNTADLSRFSSKSLKVRVDDLSIDALYFDEIESEIDMLRKDHLAEQLMTSTQSLTSNDKKLLSHLMTLRSYLQTAVSIGGGEMLSESEISSFSELPSKASIRGQRMSLIDLKKKK